MWIVLVAADEKNKKNKKNKKILRRRVSVSAIVGRSLETRTRNRSSPRVDKNRATQSLRNLT